MKRLIPVADANAYVDALDGWQRERVEQLRASVQASAPLAEVVKWGHLVYFDTGPVLLIRAEERRVLFGFWRGQRLQDIEPRLKPGGKYEMATLEFDAVATISDARIRKLTRQAVALNREFGDPTKIARPKLRSKTTQRAKRK